MIVCTSVGTLPGQPGETVQRQLSLEGAKTSMPKVFGHHVLNKAFWFVNVESASMVLPGDNVGETKALRVVQHVMQNFGKH